MTYGAPRRATLDDLEILVRHRVEMFADMGTPRNGRSDAMARACAPWFRERIADGRYVGFLIAAQGRQAAVAGAGVLLLDWPPTCIDPGTMRGYILNVYVEKEHRGRGLARRLTQLCIDECVARGLCVATLHAADAARPLYERMGFVATNEMRRDVRCVER